MRLAPSAATGPATAIAEATLGAAGERGGDGSDTAAAGPTTDIGIVMRNLGGAALLASGPAADLGSLDRMGAASAAGSRPMRTAGPTADRRGSAASHSGLWDEGSGGPGNVGTLGRLERHQAVALLGGEGEVVGEACCAVPARARALGHGWGGGEETDQEDDQDTHVGGSKGMPRPTKVP